MWNYILRVESRSGAKLHSKGRVSHRCKILLLGYTNFTTYASYWKWKFLRKRNSKYKWGCQFRMTCQMVTWKRLQPMLTHKMVKSKRARSKNKEYTKRRIANTQIATSTNQLKYIEGTEYIIDFGNYWKTSLKFLKHLLV